MQNTSQEAAELIKPSAATLREKVYKYLEVNGPSTDEDIQRGLGMNPSTERPRRGELVKQSLVFPSGRTSLTTSGRRAIVWVTAKQLIRECISDPEQFASLLVRLGEGSHGK